MGQREIRRENDPGAIVHDEIARLTFMEEYKGGRGWVLYFINAKDDVESKFFPVDEVQPHEVMPRAQEWLEKVNAARP